MTFVQFLLSLPLSASERVSLHANLLLRGRHYFLYPEAVGLDYVVAPRQSRPTVDGVLGCLAFGVVLGFAFGLAF